MRTINDLVVGIVGPCAAGKTTLVARLREKGIEVRHIAQEHSYVPDMWQRLSKPDVLIFLDVTYHTSLERRKLNWTENEYNEQQRRLGHARQNANLIIKTDDMTADEVEETILVFLYKRD
jgi:guanylate kinase